jgi:hypothetical protein
LNIEAAKMIRYGGLTEEEALKLVTLNPAMQLGVDNRLGTIDVGKDADVVVWSAHPLSVYAHVEQTFVDANYFSIARRISRDANNSKQNGRLWKRLTRTNHRLAAGHRARLQKFAARTFMRTTFKIGRTSHDEKPSGILPLIFSAKLQNRERDSERDQDSTCVCNHRRVLNPLTIVRGSVLLSWFQQCSRAIAQDTDRIDPQLTNTPADLRDSQRAHRHGEWRGNRKRNVVISGGKIAAVGANVSAPAARRRSTERTDVYPGMIDLGTNMGW